MSFRELPIYEKRPFSWREIKEEQKILEEKEQKCHYCRYKFDMELKIRELTKENENLKLIVKYVKEHNIVLKNCNNDFLERLGRYCNTIIQLQEDLMKIKLQRISVQQQKKREEKIADEEAFGNSPAQKKIYEIIKENCVGFGELAEISGYDKGRLSKILKALFQKGKIKKRGKNFEILG